MEQFTPTMCGNMPSLEPAYLNKGRSGRNSIARSTDNVEAVRNAIEEARGEAPEERISCRRNGLGLSSATFNQITRLDLHFHPYQMIRRLNFFLVIFLDDSGFSVPDS